MRLVITMLFLLGAVQVQATECKVSDPTNTPLNLRTYPNGAKVGIVRNGNTVRMLDYDTDERGRTWAYIRTKQGKRGWVYREFISCLRY